jgi:HAMP domain-containing protein
MSFFRDTSIGKKILIPPLIMVVALGAVLLIAIHGFNKQGSVLSEVHHIALERTTLVNEFISLSERLQSDLFRIAVLRYMNLPDKEIQPIHENLELGLSNLGVIYDHILNKWFLDQKEKKILDQMSVPMDAFSHDAQQAAAVVSQNPSFGILLVRSAVVPFADLKKLLTEFLDYQKEKIVQAETISKQTVDTVKTTAIAIALFTAFMGIFITVWIGTRLISGPVRSKTEVMDQLAGGDLSAKVADLRRRDEIGSMAKAVEVFRKNAIEKQAAEEALRESEEKYRHLYLNTPVMLHSIDSQGRLLSASNN